MATPTTTFFTLTVRGTTRPKTQADARTLHNETAGSPQGMAAARAASDLSHKVYVPCEAAGEMSGTKPNELLFLDVWTDPGKLNAFFSVPMVHEQAGKMFVERDGQLWVPSASGFGFDLPAPESAPNRYVGMMVRVQVTSIEKAAALFREVNEKHLADARRLGQLSHRLAFKFAGPGAPPAAELLGIDVWTDLKGMAEHYERTMAPLAACFADKPQTSVWEQAKGFNEW